MLTAYFALKHIHVTCVILSISFFILRFYWRIRLPLNLQKNWVRIAPHCIDSVLLASAIALAWISAQVPFVQAWLGAKIIALIVYIILGSFALKRTKSFKTSLIAFIAALLVFAYIVSVAITKQVMLVMLVM